MLLLALLLQDGSALIREDSQGEGLHGEKGGSSVRIIVSHHPSTTLQHAPLGYPRA